MSQLLFTEAPKHFISIEKCTYVKRKLLAAKYVIALVAKEFLMDASLAENTRNTLGLHKDIYKLYVVDAETHAEALTIAADLCEFFGLPLGEVDKLKLSACKSNDKGRGFRLMVFERPHYSV